MEQFREYLPFIAIAVLVGAIIGYLLFRPRQRVRLSDSTPVRPHMTTAVKPKSAVEEAPREGQGIVAEAAAAASDVTGQIIGARVGAVPADVADDFQRLKGVGPKFAQVLHARGFFRFDQLASLTPEEISRLDTDLGPFRGRITRDRIVEQADYLARGDQDGFEEKFGKL